MRPCLFLALLFLAACQSNPEKTATTGQPGKASTHPMELGEPCPSCLVDSGGQYSFLDSPDLWNRDLIHTLPPVDSVRRAQVAQWSREDNPNDPYAYLSYDPKRGLYNVICDNENDNSYYWYLVDFEKQTCFLAAMFGGDGYDGWDTHSKFRRDVLYRYSSLRTDAEDGTDEPANVTTVDSLTEAFKWQDRRFTLVKKDSSHFTRPRH